MPSSFEKSMLLSLGLIGIWFLGTTLHFSTRIAALANKHQHANNNGTSNNLRGQMINSFLHNNNNNNNYNYNKKDMKHKISQIKFATGNVNKPLDKIPFPQTIVNEEWDTIIHPSVVMRPSPEIDKDHADKDADTYSNKDVDKEADEQKYAMKVPKFWNPSILKQDVRQFLGNNGQRLISADEASRIGSYTPSLTNYDVEQGDAELKVDHEDTTGNISNVLYTISNDLPPEELEMLETIYVTIASYRDPRCPHTVEMLFKQAKYPERIRVGIVDQIDLEEDVSCAKPEVSCEEDKDQTLCRYSHQIDVFQMDAQLAVGPVFARHIGDRMYRGEYYVMQCDAHMEFVKHWDEDVIFQWKSAENEMAVLTTYVSDVDNHYEKKNGGRITNARPFMCETDFEEDSEEGYPELTFLMHGQQPEEKPTVKGEPLLIPYWAAGFSFSRGHFAVQVPYDQYQPMIFQGEEINMGVRAFTYGYDFYAPEKSVLYHYYHTSKDGKKRPVKRFWEHADSYEGIAQISKARLLGIIEMLGAAVIPEEENENEPAAAAVDGKEKNADTDAGAGGGESGEEGEFENVVIHWVAIEADKYGLGKVRTVQKFLDTFGIDLKEKKVQKHLCRFVSDAMTRIFTKEIRSDGMGIDYDKIDFQFTDPEVNGNTWEKYLE